MPTLICYDGSPSAQRALTVAHDTLAGGAAVLLHVWNPPDAVLADSFSTRAVGTRAVGTRAVGTRAVGTRTVGPREPAAGATATVDRLEEMARHRAGEVVAEGLARAAALGIAVDAREAPSHHGVWQTILEIADEIGAELIVAGTHGTTAVQEQTLGSVSGGLVHHSRRPVLIVPAGPPTAP